MLYSYDIFDTVLYRFVPKSVDVFRVMEQKESVVHPGRFQHHFPSAEERANFGFVE